MPEQTYVELVTVLQGRDMAMPERHAAFSELVTRFQDMVHGACFARLSNHALAQDAAQETFIAAYHHLAELREPRAFPSWLRRLAVTQCSRLTRSPHARNEALDHAELLPESEPGPDERAERASLRDAVMGAVADLPDHERETTILYYIDGYAQAEVAEFLDVSEPTVRKRLQRARDRMRETMMNLLRDDLAGGRPSRDDEFLRRVQLATTLEEAGILAQLSVIEATLVDGMDVNAIGEGGQTLLHWAAARGHGDAVDLLLRLGADVTLVDRYGRTARRLALDAGHVDLAARLAPKDASCD